MSTSTLALLALMSLQRSSTSTITWNDLSGGVQTVLIFLAIVVGIAYIVFVGFCGAIVGDLLKGKNAVALQYVAGWLLLSVGWTCVLLPCIAYYVAAISLFIVGIIPAIIFKTIYIRLCTSESFLHNITPRKFLSAIGVPPIFFGCTGCTFHCGWWEAIGRRSKSRRLRRCLPTELFLITLS